MEVSHVGHMLLHIACRWQSKIAKQAVELVSLEDKDDLYFEKGHHSQEFVNLVVSRHTCLLRFATALQFRCQRHQL